MMSHIQVVLFMAIQNREDLYTLCVPVQMKLILLLLLPLTTRTRIDGLNMKGERNEMRCMQKYRY